MADYRCARPRGRNRNILLIVEWNRTPLKPISPKPLKYCGPIPAVLPESCSTKADMKQQDSYGYGRSYNCRAFV
jgi:hypothetical protein